VERRDALERPGGAAPGRPRRRLGGQRTGGVPLPPADERRTGSIIGAPAGGPRMDTFIRAEDNPPSSTDVSIHERQAELAKNTKPTLFKLKAQLLDQGRTDTVLAATDSMSVRLKVYAE